MNAFTDLTGHGTLLLVEDDESVRALIARGLRSRGFDVIEAANGREALEALAHRAVDLVVCDVIMPEMDGPTLAKARPDLKILFISGYAVEGLPFLPKPFTLGQLVTAVKETMGRWHNENTNHQQA
jgi:two-component system cell cycle sensor histidine kinase/response regulator CckA